MFRKEIVRKNYTKRVIGKNIYDNTWVGNDLGQASIRGLSVNLTLIAGDRAEQSNKTMSRP